MDIIEVLENIAKTIERDLNILERRFPVFHYWLGFGLYILLTTYFLPIILFERDGKTVKESFKIWHQLFWINPTKGGLRG